MQRRLRNESIRLRAFTSAIYEWSNSPNASLYNSYYMLKKYQARVSLQEYINLLQDIADEKFNIVYARIDERLKNGTLTVNDIGEEIVGVDVDQNVMDRLFNQIYYWRNLYIDNSVQSLKKLAMDTQNVHTEVVNKQTQSSLDLLEHIIVNRSQRTLDEIATIWSFNPSIAKRLTPVYNDMKYWADKSYVINPDDYLYRKTLRGLWAKIKSFDNDLRISLTQRLWQECEESVGMCAQGHLSRLANVLVGFDDNFKSPQSPMIAFQDAISHIASSDLSSMAKQSKALALMDEISMPEDKREAWLLAL